MSTQWKVIAAAKIAWMNRDKDVWVDKNSADCSWIS